VLDKVDLAGSSPVLLVGFGGTAYREAALGRWPDLAVEVRNPFNGENGDSPARVIASSPGPFGAILFSGLLGGCERDQFRPALERAASSLRRGGVLILHDSFLSSDTPPAPEIVLSALGRHVLHGGARNWPVARLQSELRSIGLQVQQREAIPGGTQLITAIAV
jgi:hypothetical protein